MIARYPAENPPMGIHMTRRYSTSCTYTSRRGFIQIAKARVARKTAAGMISIIRGTMRSVCSHPDSDTEIAPVMTTAMGTTRSSHRGGRE